MTDNEIIQLIRSNDLEKPVKELYRSFSMTSRLLIKHGAQKEYTHEIFNDALVILIEKTSSPEFELQSKLSTYLSGIAINLLRNRLRRQQTREQYIRYTADFTDPQSEDTYDYDQENRLKIMDGILNKLQDRCRQMLELFYLTKKSMQEIADTLGFSSVNSAKTQKYKCLERAHRLAQEQLQTSKTNRL